MKYKDLVESQGYFSTISFKYNPFDIPENDFSGFRIQLQAFLKAHCGEALTAYRKTGMPLHRALKWRDSTPATVFYNRAVPGMRRPVDSKSGGHDFVNEVLTIAGFDARRDNSIFATSAKEHTRQYGDTGYLVFPVDGFKFTYSTKVRDWIGITNTHNPENLYHRMKSDIETVFFKKFADYVSDVTNQKIDEYHFDYHNLLIKATKMLNKTEEEIEKIIKSLNLENLWFFIKNTGGIITSSNYLHFIDTPIYKCLSPYHKEMYNYFKNKRVTPELAKAIIEKFEIKNNNFIEAIEARHEVMIHGDNVLVNYEWMDRLLNNGFL